MRTDLHQKVTVEHLRREAFVYVQSWLGFFGQADKWNDCYIFPQ